MNLKSEIRGLKHTLATFLCVLACVSGGNARAQGILVDGVAAHVNERVITIGEVVAVVEQVRPQLMARFKGAELTARLEEAYRKALESLIDRYLVLDAYESGDAKLPEWVVDERVEMHIAKEYDGDKPALLSLLQDDETTFEDWRGQFEDQIVLSLMKSTFVDQKVSVSPKEVSELYHADPEKYRTPARYRLRMIMIRSKEDDSASNRRRAERALKRVTGGESFADVAREMSDGQRAQDGGDWGWVSAEMLRSVLRETVEALDVGQHSNIVYFGGEFFIAFLEDREDEKIAAFEEVQPRIQRELRLREASALYDAWLNRLRAAAYVKTFDVSL